MTETVITEKDAGRTVKDVLLKDLRVSARFLTKLKYASDCGITVNSSHVTVRYVLQSGDVLHLALEDETPSARILPVALPVSVLYEDDDVIAVNKPADMPTHPSHGHLDDTLANALAFRFREAGVPFVFRPVTRLDRNTSGVVLIAKNPTASSHLYRSMSQRIIQKEYIALLDGIPSPDVGCVTHPICRQSDSVICRIVCDANTPGAMPSMTEYRTLVSANEHALVSVRPLTGRTHQIRVHMASVGCPITGDDLYGHSSTLITRQALHAYTLTFPHPADGHSLTVCAPLPDDMQNALNNVFGKEIRLHEFQL